MSVGSTHPGGNPKSSSAFSTANRATRLGSTSFNILSMGTAAGLPTCMSTASSLPSFRSVDRLVMLSWPSFTRWLLNHRMILSTGSTAMMSSSPGLCMGPASALRRASSAVFCVIALDATTPASVCRYSTATVLYALYVTTSSSAASSCCPSSTFLSSETVSLSCIAASSLFRRLISMLAMSRSASVRSSRCRSSLFTARSSSTAASERSCLAMDEFCFH
mmetsp:Transcript_3871/g.9287  ORF Transcript_3871/g.9287 Transcript_3871/m.9287 type:complete len:220 (+) Transcript_3871:314-973(+)